MAGQGPRESQDHGRSSRRGWSVRRAAEASGPASGPRHGKRANQTRKGSKDSRPVGPLLADQATTRSGRTTERRLTTTPGRPASTPVTHDSSPKTRVICRLLELRGLTSDEAARLTAFLYGFPTTDLGWSPRQLNRLLFLRRLREAGAFEGSGRPILPT